MLFFSVDHNFFLFLEWEKFISCLYSTVGIFIHVYHVDRIILTFLSFISSSIKLCLNYPLDFSLFM